MKASQKDFKSLAPRAAREAHVFFLCGPDDAGVQDAAQLLISLLPDAGVRLLRLESAQPQAAELRAALDGRLADPRVVIVPGAEKALQASFDTPAGIRLL